MHQTLRACLRVVGLTAMAIVIAHCGDGNNDNVTEPPKQTPTPTAAAPTATPTVTVTTGTPVVTITPTPGASCPSAISFEGNPSAARLDPGWTGLGHEAGVIDKGKITMAVTGCENSTRPCGTCNLSGPISNRDANQGVANNQRCSGDTSIECTSDATCTAAGAGTCKFYFGAPLSLSAGGTSTCVINEVDGSITGTANTETGEGASTANLISHVFLGLLTSPCPRCVGDPTPEDGVRGGTCTDGVRVGLACDVSGTHLNPYFGSTSFDCPLPATGAIAALPIHLANSTRPTTRTLSAESPNCRDTIAAPGKKCFCDTCNNLAAGPCFSNADCVAVGATICGGRRCRLGPNAGNPCTVNSECPSGACSVPGLASKPNACDDTVCSPLASDPTLGECAAGPFEQFCGPHASFAGCFADAECAAFDRCAGGANDGFIPCTVNSQCPGGTCEIQTCSIGKKRPCFLDNGNVGGGVTAVGVADVPVGGVSHPTLAALFCLAATGNGAVDTAAGLPGLGRLKLGGTAVELE